MQFGVLGPLEVVEGGESLALGGTKQRATLGYLLLRANRVAAASQLLNALWPVDDAPPSARKILQNAVWGLRRVLTAADGSVSLLTQPPGYRLVVPVHDVDLFRFQGMVERGRERLAAGEPEVAADVLRDALALWRGPILADLVEADIVWPELAAAENSRLDAMEDYFDAQLACGRHQAMLGELEAVVEHASALRERSCRQLMLALYRSGRQVDALNVYSRTRAALVEELGLEPGRELQLLQLQILAQDPALELAARSTATAIPGAPAAPAAVREHTAPAPSAPSVPPAQSGPSAPPVPSLPLAPLAPPEGGSREDVSVLLVRSEVGAGASGDDVDGDLERLALWTRDSIEQFGGKVAATIGLVSMATFPVPEGDCAERRAVLSALAVRDGLRVFPAPAGADIAFRAAVVTGAALMRYSPGERSAPVAVTGQVVDRCHALLAHAAAGEIRLCDRTRQATEAVFVCDQAVEPGEWVARGVRRDAEADAMPMVEREFELSLLSDLMERARHQVTSHLVTIVGDAGIGKTRLLTEFGQSIGARAYTARFNVGAGRSASGDVFDMCRELVLALCQVQPSDTVAVRLEKLERTIRDLVTDEARVEWLLACLTAYIDPDADRAHLTDDAVELEAWWRLLGPVTLQRTLVLLVDDLHRASEPVLNLISRLADFADAPLLVVATAHPSLFELRPDWGGGKRHITTLTLEPLSDAAVDRLLETAGGTAEPRTALGWLRQLLHVNLDSRPDDRRQYLRSLLSMHPPRMLTHGAPSSAAG
ncbi:BTAD domain-containing putative transcriptional regulator [Dactylosporangium sp. NPDC051485]|uniref:BTAD domain-containing putative transcriptional regulator n=1 Tax=Dactylosporangium sp. NPDC051485 TaxID=3154846 RepID=UPI00341A9351